MQYDNHTSPSFFSNFLGSAYIPDDLTAAPATVDPRAAFPVVSSGSHLDEPGLWRIDNLMYEPQTTSENLKQAPRFTFPWATLPSNEHLDLPAALPPLNSVSKPRSHLKANRKDKWICECNFEADKNYKMSRHKKYSCPLGPKQVPQCPTCHRSIGPGFTTLVLNTGMLLESPIQEVTWSKASMSVAAEGTLYEKAMAGYQKEIVYNTPRMWNTFTISFMKLAWAETETMLARSKATLHHRTWTDGPSILSEVFTTPTPHLLSSNFVRGTTIYVIGVPPQHAFPGRTRDREFPYIRGRSKRLSRSSVLVLMIAEIESPFASSDLDAKMDKLASINSGSAHFHLQGFVGEITSIDIEIGVSTFNPGRARGIPIACSAPIVKPQTLVLGGSFAGIERTDWSNLFTRFQHVRILVLENVPGELFSMLKRLHETDTQISFPKLESILFRGCSFDGRYADFSLAGSVPEFFYDRDEFGNPVETLEIQHCRIIGYTVAELSGVVHTKWYRKSLPRDEYIARYGYGLDDFDPGEMFRW
ncbi:hypothetical protein PLEOSDRAFT_1086600 [Pleurotus ostreatus PC15]|uniref:Uncharacterized protein n=1 Tax=Pleurotus ostreatus (strain PC15) TaxID=1137138 RepID=A0A067N8A4_PLEO1|nr:hypothetical protein PLEOSDRAFT_1086600 [Pleurotus ostreatus PC15]